MSLDRRIRASRLVAAAAVGVLLGGGIAVASAATPAYTGAVTFGAPTVSRACSSGAPRSVAVSIPINATQLTAPVERRFYARFSYVGKTLGWLISATPVRVTIRPQQKGTISHRFTIPTSRPFNVVEIGLLNPQGRTETFERFALTCASPAPTAFLAPTVTKVSHPCSGVTTVRVASNSGRTWSLTPLLSNGQVGPTVPIAPHSTRTVLVGRASQGADRFTLSATARAGGTSTKVALIVFSEACVR